MDEIKIGTPVYHVEEYRLSNYELKQKGFEGFDNYGLEVVESVVIAVTDTHFDTITEKRDIGSNTNNIHHWERLALGRAVFLSKEEAAEEADNRAHNIQLGYHCSKFSQRPMYKNWLHWQDAAKAKPFKKQTGHRSNFVAKKTTLPEELYIAWRDGKLTGPEGAKKIGVCVTTFERYAREELAKRGDRHTVKTGNKVPPKPLPPMFDDCFEQWKLGLLSDEKAARQCGMSHTTFRKYANIRLKEIGEQRKEIQRGVILPPNFTDVYLEWEQGDIGCSEAAKKCGLEYYTFRYYAEKRYNERMDAGVFQY